MTNYLFWPVWFLMWVGMLMGMYYSSMGISPNMRLLILGIAITVISYIFASSAANDLHKNKDKYFS